MSGLLLAIVMFVPRPMCEDGVSFHGRYCDKGVWVEYMRTVWDEDYRCEQKGEGWRWTGKACVRVEDRCPVCGAKGVDLGSIEVGCRNCLSFNGPELIHAWRCPSDGILFTTLEQP